MKRSISLALVLMLLTSMLMGCSSGTSNKDGNKDDDSSKLTKVTVAVPSGLEVLGYAHWLCAEYMGYFEEEGIELNMIPQEGADVCKMMVAGQCDIAVPAPSVIFPAVTSGIDMYVVYQHDCTNIFGFAVLENSDIHEWKDLEGASVATDGSWYLFSDPILKSADVDVESVEYVSAPDERSVLLSAGTVDAAFTWEKEWQLWDAQGIPIRYLAGEDVLKNSANALVCKPEYYENNKEVIERLGRALAKGTYFCEANALAAAQITVKRWPTLGLTAEEAMPSIEALAICSTPTTGNYGEAELTRWEASLEWLDYFDMVDGSQIDLKKLLKTSELMDAFNDWDRNEVKSQAEKFDINSVSNWN